MACIRKSTRQDKEQVDKLRLSEFQCSGNFELLEPQRLLWNQRDDDNVVLTAWDDLGRAVSTMRAVLLPDAVAAVACLECTVPRIGYPAVAFTSAATRSSHRGLGLNQALRYHFMLAAQANGVQTLFSPVYEGAPRLSFMKELGYYFDVPQHCWQTKLRPNSRRILGILTRGHMAGSIEMLHRKRRSIIEAYPYQGTAILLRSHGRPGADDMGEDCLRIAV